jgi:protein-tyrosine-phosphatase
MVAACGPAAALTNPLESGLRKCAGEADQVARLACFDALVTTIPTVDADSFGLTAEIARKRQPAEAAAAAASAATENVALPAKVVALSLAPRGEIIFTLDNRQVWMQAHVEPGKQFSLGDVVRIEHGAMGSYWLAADKARKTKVKRVS